MSKKVLTATNRDGKSFFEKVPEILREGKVYGQNENSPVIEFVHPEELKEILKLSLDEVPNGSRDDELEELCKKVVKYSVKTNHRHFHNQLYGGLDLYGLAGTWIAEALNTSQYTYEVAPAFTLAEQTVISHTLNKIGWTEGDGIFSPGGSLSNMYGMVVARYRAYPDVKSKGVHNLPQLVAFTSQDAHYSLLKASHWLGVGTDNLVIVKTNDRGQMIPEELDLAVRIVKAEGRKPFFVNVTAGTTVLGAFDCLDRLADVCERHELWMHVDACWGGTLLLSRKYRHLMDGIERADSVAWNPHKMLGAPLQCSLLMVRHKQLLFRSNAAAARYLFQQDKFYDVSYDTGDKSVQCGRKVDAFKLWLMWRARGDNGLEELVNNAMEAAEYFRTKISNLPGYKMVIPADEFQCSNICFWFIPKRLRGQTEDDKWWEKIHKVAPLIKAAMTISGALMVGYTPLKNLKNFFRVVVTCQPPPTHADMDYIVQQIDKFGENM